MERVSNKNIAIIGAGSSGCLCAYFLLNAGFKDITLFDYGSPLRTLLPTGGGRCNLAHAEYDFKELAKNYPRGEKFLYSVFSKFSTYDTIALFNELGIETYVQENNRIFPTSNNARDVQQKILNKIKNATIINEKVISIKTNKIKTQKSEYFFDKIVIAIGGHAGCDLFAHLDIKIIPLRPSLVGLKTSKPFTELSGIVAKQVYSKDFGIREDILFTHFGLSGPLIYQISSLKAMDKFPYKLTFDFYPNEFNLQELMNKNPHKELKNILNNFFSQNLSNFLLGDYAAQKAHTINGYTRDLILDRIHNFEVKVIGTNKGEETVSAGGVDLNEVNSGSMELKKFPTIYVIGEILNIDGFCGGFNLQNAWSTAYIAAQDIINKSK